jgi:lysyl-tRNA synthetase class 1
MYWADKIADEIIKSEKHKPYWIDDMKTPSGYAHIGSLLGPVIHSTIFRALKRREMESTFTFVINDFDPVDGLPAEMMDEYGKYMGFPLKTTPSPDQKFESMADYYANDFTNAFRSLGVEAELLSSWSLYHEGKFDEVIKTALDKAEKIADIYQKVAGSQKRQADWLPFQVICEKCGKLGTTRVYDWNGEKVSYKCEPNLVEWAEGCGVEGKISPFGGAGKLPWKVDWAAHWKVIGVTIEGAGKDHASAGGSYDIAMVLCKEVFNYPQPYKLPYEFILFGGRKMSSSKGIGLKAHDLVKIVPPSVGRFLLIKGDIKSQSNFDPVGMAIPNLFDNYDKAASSFWEGKDDNLAKAFEYAQVDGKMPKKHFLPRFVDVARHLQDAKIEVNEKFEEIKGEPLSYVERQTLKERIKYARAWLTEYAPEEEVFAIGKKPPDEAQALTNEQMEYLKKVRTLLGQKWTSPEDLQTALYNAVKETDIPAKEAFAGIYLVLIGKSHGPKAAWFLTENLKEAKKRLRQF